MCRRFYAFHHGRDQNAHATRLFVYVVHVGRKGRYREGFTSKRRQSPPCDRSTIESNGRRLAKNHVANCASYFQSDHISGRQECIYD